MSEGKPRVNKQTRTESPSESRTAGWCREIPGGVSLSLKVQAGAKKTCLSGHNSEYLLIKIAEPAIEGAANREIIKFLAKTFSVKSERIVIRLGEHSRVKVVFIQGLAMDRVLQLVADHSFLK